MTEVISTELDSSNGAHFWSSIFTNFSLFNRNSTCEDFETIGQSGKTKPKRNESVGSSLNSLEVDEEQDWWNFPPNELLWEAQVSSLYNISSISVKRRNGFKRRII